TPWPSPTPSSPAPEKVTNAAQTAATDAAAQPASAGPEDFWHQETMTGDWGGTRSKWKEKGVELEFRLANFYQGIASGGLDTTGNYTGKFEMTWKFDLAKVAGWKFWSSEIEAETRFGGTANLPTGGINPTNTAAIVPGADGSVISITAVNF